MRMCWRSRRRWGRSRRESAQQSCVPRLPRSVIASILVAITLGALTTIVTAWTLALWPATSALSSSGLGISNPVDPTFHRMLCIEEEKRVGLRWTQLSVSCQYPNYVRAKWDPLTGMDPTPAHWYFVAIDEPVIRDRLRSFPARSQPRWPGWLPSLPNNRAGLVSWGGRAAGWPMLCLRSMSHAVEGDSALAWSWTLTITSANAYRTLLLRDPAVGSIPLLPEPVGFAANTGVYGALWFAALTIPSGARRALRRRRGACPRCAYDLRGLAPATPCPECGAEGGGRGGRRGKPPL